MGLNVKISNPLMNAIQSLATAMGKTPTELIDVWLSERLVLAGYSLTQCTEKKGCLLTGCPRKRKVRGLCGRHYQRYNYLKTDKGLDESWMVHNGKILPYRGRAIEDYGPGVAPGNPSAADPDALWFFGRTP